MEKGRGAYQKTSPNSLVTWSFLRNFAMVQHNTCLYSSFPGTNFSPLLIPNISGMQWCILERIGRARELGEVTQVEIKTWKINWSKIDRSEFKQLSVLILFARPNVNSILTFCTAFKDRRNKLKYFNLIILKKPCWLRLKMSGTMRHLWSPLQGSNKFENAPKLHA